MGWFCYRFHRHCVGLSSEQVSNLDKYICPTCAPDNSKKSNGPLQKTPEAKVILPYATSLVCKCLWLVKVPVYIVTGEVLRDLKSLYSKFVVKVPGYSY